MPNFTGLLRAPRLDFEVTLRRKPTLDQSQNIRARVEHVKAHDRAGAKEAAMAINDNHRFFNVSSVREIR